MILPARPTLSLFKLRMQPTWSTPAIPTQLRGMARGAILLTSLLTAVACGGGTEPKVDPPAAITTIVVAGGAIQTVERGSHTTFTATARDKDGNTVTVPFVWRSSNETLATFDANGRLTATDTGVIVVNASSLGVTSASVLVHIDWVGPAKLQLFQFTAPGAASPGVIVQDSLRVQVLNRVGGPAVAAKVTFAVTAGGGMISPVTATTNVFGVATVQWTLGSAFGVNTVSATVLGDDDKPLTFVTSNPVTASIRSYQALSVSTGDNQTATLLQPVAISPSVKVVDTAGKPRPGVPVTFTPAANGRVTTSTVSTDANGVATPGTWTLGDIPGDQTLLARVESATLTLHATGTGTPVRFKPSLAVAGAFSSCALLPDQSVDCWGEATKTGTGTSTKNRFSPTPVIGPVKYTALASGVSHSCGIADDQGLYCWGFNALADTSGSTLNALAPSRIQTDLSWLKVDTGLQHTCAIATDGKLYCWGNDQYGQLGDRGNTAKFSPQAVAGGFSFNTISSGTYHSCALTVDGSAFCWGLNGNGQLGDGSTSDRSAPTVVGGGISFQAIRAGDSWTCGLSTAGKAYCWGNVSAATPKLTTPTTYAGAPTFTSISTKGGHACALTAAGVAYCWGNNSNGQVGDSTTVNRDAPVAVAGGLTFTSITAGYVHTCGIISSGALACWGLNQSGELGDSTASFRLVPHQLVLGVTP